ncbi:MAG: phosphoribosyltransferase [Sphingomonadaceae bacterium]
MSLGSESVVEAFLDGLGREHLDETLRYLSVNFGCSVAGLVVVGKQGTRTVSAIGSKVRASRLSVSGRGTGGIAFPIATEEPDALAALSEHFPIAAGSRNLLVMPVIEFDSAHLLVLACASFPTGAHFAAAAAAGIPRILQILKSQVRLLAELAESAAAAPPAEPSLPAGVSDPAEEFHATGAEQPEVVSDFLLSTLIRRRSMRIRRDVVYFGVRSWRSPLKSYQIAALRALKRSPPPTFLRAVAAEVAAEAMRLAGRDAFRSVTAVPCGHSAPDGFSHQLGQYVARHLQLPFAEVFAYRPVKGSSHPRTNVSRPPMQLLAAPGGNTLLVDDVATSGAHIAEASALLRKGGTNVTPLAWISG